jgi:hypothetical protein
MGRRYMRAQVEAGICYICEGLHTRKRTNGKAHSYCHSCHAAYMRKNRPKHSELAPLARMKANARAYANAYQARGKLKPEPCLLCGSTDVQKHHVDYGRPLDVLWFCRPCHLEQHENMHK